MLMLLLIVTAAAREALGGALLGNASRPWMFAGANRPDDGHQGDHQQQCGKDGRQDEKQLGGETRLDGLLQEVAAAVAGASIGRVSEQRLQVVHVRAIGKDGDEERAVRFLYAVCRQLVLDLIVDNVGGRVVV